MATKTYYTKSAGAKNLYQPSEKELLYNIESWNTIKGNATTPKDKRYAEDRIRTLEERLLHLREAQDMRDDTGPEIELEPGHEFPSRGQGSPTPIRGSRT